LTTLERNDKLAIFQLENDFFISLPAGGGDVVEPKENFKKTLADNLVVLRLIYVVSYTMAYYQISNIFPYKFSVRSISDNVLLIFASVVLFFLSVRFYWAVGNIKRHLFETIDAVGETEWTNKLKLANALKWPLRGMLFFHVPVLMAHSFMVFLLSRHLVDMSEQMQCGSLEHASITAFLAMYCGLLFLNSFWLWWLKTKGEECPERFWMKNNAVFATIGVIWILIECRLGISNQLFLTTALCLFSANNALDFWYCYQAYSYERAA
jgi:hypothetical protein